MTKQEDALLERLREATLALRKMRTERDALAFEKVEPIAIVGIGCRFPGGADSPDAFWELLDAGRDAVQPLDKRWSLLGAHPPEDVPRWAGLLTEAALEGFDAGFFGVSPREARSLDPQQRLLLEVAWEAFEDAGIPPGSLVSTRTGVFVGACAADYNYTVSRQRREEQDAYSTTGSMLSIAAGRLSYTLGLEGPCLTVDTACSSSLVATHLGCRSLRDRESDLVLAGGVNLLLSPDTMAALGRTQALSPEGRCKTFDASASGYVRGEGCGLVVLKRLSDARRDGDRIWALIRGSAVNQDGRSTGLTTPNVLAQERLLRDALRSARVDAGSIGYVETHGTGTSLGDPIEVEALRAVVGPKRPDGTSCVLGAVKTNLGHLEGAAGVVGLIKAALSLHHERIPRNINFRTLNPRIRLEGTALAVAAKPVAWPRTDQPRFAGVSGFGLSGTNAHVVLEEAPAEGLKPAAPARSGELAVLSAKSAAALDAQAARLRDHLKAHPGQGLGDVAFSLATTRDPLKYRLAVSATSCDALREALDGASRGQTPPGVVRGTASSRGKLAFLFTGQGAQVLGMGRALCAAWPPFREAFERCVGLFDRELPRPLCEVMWAEPDSAEAALLDQTGYTQPALFAVEYALCALWRSWGVQPELVAGHSIGELTAACVAGVFSLEDAVRLVAARGRLMQALPAGGAMVSIAATEAEVAAAVAPHAASVSIAAVNGPAQVVIAGAEDPVKAIAGGFAARGVRTKPLRVSHAFHSPLMGPMLEAFQHVAEAVVYHRPAMPLISNLTGRPVTDEVSEPGYWVRHVREAVRFADGVKALREVGVDTFIEVGPKSTLLGLVPACLPDADPALVASLRAGRDEAVSALEALGGFWASGGMVDWTRLFPAGGRRVPLPTYPWQRERFWVDSNGARRADLPAPASTVGRWPLAGARVRMPGTQLHHVLSVGPVSQPFLADHTVFGKVVVPGAFYISVILAVAAERWPARALEVTGVEFLRGIALEPGQEVELHAVLTPDATGDGYEFELATCSEQLDGEWTTHARGRVHPTDGIPGAVPQPDALEHRATETVDTAVVFERLSSIQVEWGPLWRWLRAGRSGPGCSVCTIVPTFVDAYEAGPLHPCLLDNGFGASVLNRSTSDREDSTTRLPFAVDRVRWWRAPRGSVQCAGISRSHPADVVDLVLTDEDGGVVAEVEGLATRLAPREVFLRQESIASSAALFQLDWPDTPLAAAPRTGGEESWVVVAAPGSPMAAALGTRLDHCIVVDLAGLDAALVQASSGAGVICLWEAHPEEAVPDVAQRVAIEGLSVVRTLRERAPARLWWVTKGAVPVGLDDATAVAAAPIWGLGRTVMQELPELDCTLVDLAPGAEAVDQLVRELSASDGENQVAWRAGRRHVARLARAAALTPAPWAPPTQGTVLLSGGLGALGLHVARWLAQQGVPHLVLTGRRGLSAPGAADAVAELEALGTRVTVAAVDVADRQALRAVIEAIPVERPLRGVIHAAGVLTDGVLAEQDAERFARVLSPKITGAWNLHELTAGHDLGFFVMFSSLSGLLGGAGQGNYAAANAFLDALAAHRRASGMPAQSLAWGPWSEVGMAAGLDAAHRARLAGQGFGALSPTQGLALLGQALARPEGLLGVVSLDLRAVNRVFGAAVPAVWRALVRAPLERAAVGAQQEGTWSERLAALPAARRADEVRAGVQADIARVLALSAASDVPPDRPLSELGLDSLMAVELRNALAKRVGTALSATLAFDYPTLSGMTKYLLDEVLTLHPQAPPAEAPLVASTSVSLVDSLREPIAIIGIGCRFPGGVTSPESFWRLLDDGIDAIAEVPPARWDIDAWYDPDPDAAGKMTTRWGGFVPNLERFDPTFFGISPREAASVDPQERLLLETSWEALERAGQTPERLMGSDTAVYMGLCGTEYQALTMADAGAIDAYALLGTAHSAMVGRVSYWLGLKGPSMAVDTACSSSLVAVHLACQALRLGECSMALAGGANVVLSPEGTVYFSRLRAMSPTGRCHAFAADADGYVRSEGCGVVVLKRLSDAQRDGDTVLALIRGSAINQGGRSQGPTAPNGPSQQAVIRRALDQAGVQPAEVGYVECHGTGTPLGDPIEVQALGAALAEGRAADRPVVIGSVKSNIGHTEGAAGIAGLIKTVLALDHGRIPKSLHFTAPSPYIPWAELPVKVAAEAVEWPRNGVPRRAGVSSFGFSGTNSHVVVEEAPAVPLDDSRVAEASGYLLPISAKSPRALHALVSSFAKLLADADGPRLSDVAYTASVRRQHHEYRLAVSATSREALREALDAATQGPTLAVRNCASSGGAPKVVFVFPGQGSQWLGMGRQLLAQEPAFRASLEACDRAVQAEAGWSLLAEIGADESNSQLGRIDVVQPVLFAMEVALAALWRSWGVEPDGVVGHSMGEVAAAHVAGALSLEDAVAIICRRSLLLRRISGQGEMAMVELSLADAEAVLRGYEDRLSVAVSNSPSASVLSGEPAALAEVLLALEAKGVFCRRVKVDVASHSPQVDPLREDLLAALRDLEPRSATVPMLSTVTGATVAGPELGASYWVNNLRQPVRFADAVQALMHDGHRLFVEMSPHPILATSIEETRQAAQQEGAAVGSLRRGRDERPAMLEALGALWMQGYPVVWERLFPAGGRRVPLPTYPWQGERYWVETTPAVRHRASVDPIADWFYRVDWPEVSRAPANAQPTGSGSWLVVADQGGFGEAVAAALSSRGLSYTVLLAPVEASVVAEHVARLNAGPDGLQGVLYLGGLDAVIDAGASAGDVGEAAHRAVSPALALIQALRAVRGSPRLWIATRGACAVRDESEVAPCQAALWGLGRVAALEHPATWGGLVDLDPRGGATEVELLVAELLDPDAEDQLAFRDGHRHAARLVAAPPKEHAAPLSLSAEGSYLVTGGLGALGLLTARWLVERGARHLVLIGRHGLPDRTAWSEEQPTEIRARIAAVEALEAIGAQVTVAAVDVADAEQMTALVAGVAPPLRGVVHAAGIGPVRSLADTDAALMESVLRPKVTGSWLLHQLLRDRPLDLFVLFSSGSAVWGGHSQGAYAAANAFLDGLASQRRAEALPALSIAWGMWAEGGMGDAEIQAGLSEIGVLPMATAPAFAAMERLLQTREVQRTVTRMDWARFAPLYAARGRRNLLAALVAQEDRPTAAEAQGTWASRLAALPEEARTDEVREAVRADILRVLSVSKVSDDQPFSELGLDSLRALELRNVLGKRVGLKLPATMVFEHPTLNAITRWLLTDVLAGSKPAAPGKAPAKAHADASPAVQSGGWHSSLSAFEETRVLADGRAARYALRRAQGGRHRPALLLVHGATCNHHHLSPLADRLGQYDLLVPSLPGRCGSDGPAPVSAREAAQWIQDLLTAVDVPQVVAVGHSYGCLVVTELALLQAALPVEKRPIRGLILVAPGLAADAKFKNLLMNMVTEQEKAGATDTVLAFFAATIARALSEERLRDAARILRLTPLEARTSDIAAAEDFAFMASVRGIDLPTLMIAGSADPLAPLSHARDWVKRNPGSRLVVLDGVGHQPQLEAAEAVTEEILSFMHNLVGVSTKIASREEHAEDAAPFAP